MTQRVRYNELQRTFSNQLALSKRKTVWYINVPVTSDAQNGFWTTQKQPNLSHQAATTQMLPTEVLCRFVAAHQSNWSTNRAVPELLYVTFNEPRDLKKKKTKFLVQIRCIRCIFGANKSISFYWQKKQTSK